MAQTKKKNTEMSDELDPYPGNMERHEAQPFLSIQETKDILSDTPLKMYSREQLERMVGEVRGVYEAERARLIKENEALRKQMLTAEVFTRVVEWLKDPQRKPASTAFTAGMERQICYALELDVLPQVKSLEIRVKNMREVGEQMRDRLFSMIDKCINHGINDPAEDARAFTAAKAWDVVKAPKT